MNEFYNYLLHPTYKNDLRNINKEIFLKFYVLNFGVLIAFSILFFFVSLIFKTPQYILPTEGILNKVVYGIIIAPVFEEILFRLLLKFTFYNFLIYVVSIIVIIIYLEYQQRTNHIWIIISFIVLITILTLINYFNIVNFTKKFGIVFYLSAILFGIMHYLNFQEISITVFFVGLIYILPKIFSGLILGYLRVSYGFRYAIFFHMAMNVFILFTI